MKLKKVQGLIIDIDGVIFEGERPIGDLSSIFKKLKDLGLAFVIASNNSSRTNERVVEKFRQSGVELIENQVVNSISVTLSYLKHTLHEVSTLHVVGSQVLKDELKAAGYSLIEGISTLADAVIVGIDKDFTYDKLKNASLHIQQGAAFIATNDDRTVRTAEGLVPASGSIVAAIETASYKKAVVMGKPHAPMFELALERLGVPIEQTLIVGDQLETDISGAQSLGLGAGVVLSGVCDKSQAVAWSPVLDVVADNLQELVDMIAMERSAV